MTDVRRSGVLLHITSLPGPFGIGSLNQDAYDWVDFLAADAPDALAGAAARPHRLRRQPLSELQHLCRQSLSDQPGGSGAVGIARPGCARPGAAFPRELVDFGAIYNWKLPLLRRVAASLHSAPRQRTRRSSAQFCAENAAWLDDFALFMALKDAQRRPRWISGRCRCAAASPPPCRRAAGNSTPPRPCAQAQCSGSSTASGWRSSATPTTRAS
jgi:4-alpha-glucanotransferase